MRPMRPHTATPRRAMRAAKVRALDATPRSRERARERAR